MKILKDPLRAAERLIVVPYRPRRQLVLMGLIVLAILLGSLAGYVVTAKRLSIWRDNLVEQRDQLINNLLASVEKIESLERSLANAQVGESIDRKAGEVLQVQLVMRQKQVESLNEELSFYRNLMNPQTGQSGLDAYRFLVYGLAEENKYRYRLVLQQLGTAQRLITVAVNASLVGQVNGEEKILDFNEISTAEMPWDASIKFRYYHNIEGVISLPAGFDATEIKLSLKESRKAVKTYQFDWTILETPHAG